MNDRRNKPRQLESRPLASESAERAIIGAALRDTTVFWSIYGKLAPEHFTNPRLARVWEAMKTCGQSGKPINATWIPLFIKGDGGQDTPLLVFLAVLQNDAPPSSEVEAHVETVIHLANKRALLSSLDSARAEILDADVGMPAEVMKDIGIRMVSKAFSDNSDDDMQDYVSWGRAAARDAIANFDAGESGGAGLCPGLPSIERIIGRLLPGKLYVIAGMSSSGKSAIARQIIEAASLDAARKGSGYAYIASLEMTGQEYTNRSIAEQLGIASDRIEQGSLNQAEVEAVVNAAEDLRRFPIMVDARPRQSIENIRSRAIKVRNTRGLSLVAADHLLLIAGSKGDSILDKVSFSTIEFKNMAKEFRVPAILLAQLDEKKILESTTGWPNSSHLFGGQTIMQNADVVVFVHRPEIVLTKKEPPQSATSDNGDGKTPWEKWNARMEAVRGRAYVFTNKRRGGMPGIKEELRFHGPTMTFSEI